MTKKLYNEADIQAIADAIRLKNGATDTYKVAEMAQAIKDIPAYAGVEYVQATGAQWIDTGVPEASNETINAHFYIDSASNDYVFGSQQSGANMAYNSIYRNRVLEYNWAELRFTDADDIVLTETLDGSNITITVNGSTWTVATGSTIATTIKIFAILRRDGVTIRPYGGIVRCYYFQLYNGATLMRDYAPVVRMCDKVAGLYDKVEGKFYPNLGGVALNIGAYTGEFYV